jgi:hypothetical protein
MRSSQETETLLFLQLHLGAHLWLLKSLALAAEAEADKYQRPARQGTAETAAAEVTTVCLQAQLLHTALREEQ